MKQKRRDAIAEVPANRQMELFRKTIEAAEHAQELTEELKRVKAKVLERQAQLKALLKLEEQVNVAEEIYRNAGSPSLKEET